MGSRLHEMHIPICSFENSKTCMRIMHFVQARFAIEFFPFQRSSQCFEERGNCVRKNLKPKLTFDIFSPFNIIILGSDS